jgi:hypothetical protein
MAWHHVADSPVLHCRYKRRRTLEGHFDVGGRETCRKMRKARNQQPTLRDSHVMQAFGTSWMLKRMQARKRL